MVNIVKIDIDLEKCLVCGLCVRLCPNDVFERMENGDGKSIGMPRLEDCCACMTCSGKCPERAITVLQRSPEKRYVDDKNETPFEPLSSQARETYRNHSEILERILKLRWKPVAISLIRKGKPLPHVPVPSVRLRYCQSLIMARRGLSILMPKESHSCPDGASILGLCKIPPKLASGDIYVQLGKLASQKAASSMVEERPFLPPGLIQATLVTPLDAAVMHPDIVAVIAPPETMMWLCMALTYYSGKRMQFRMSSYNAQCVETTLYPYMNGDINLSLGCYGCRAISDIGDDMMFMGIPLSDMPLLIDGLSYLGKKAIPDARAKVYLPPMV
jgi:uncharacterized protein (DUF169 family)/NAD-dependent dihydropyrimidine dehydrogenase PreA subunit